MQKTIHINLVQQWSKSYPHILDKIGSQLLGGETKHLPNLRKECSDLSETYEQAEEILDEINELNNSFQIDFKFMFYFAVPKPGQTLEMDEERFSRILTSFDDSVPYMGKGGGEGWGAPLGKKIFLVDSRSKKIWWRSLPGMAARQRRRKFFDPTLQLPK